MPSEEVLLQEIRTRKQQEYGLLTQNAPQAFPGFTPRVIVVVQGPAALFTQEVGGVLLELVLPVKGPGWGQQALLDMLGHRQLGL